MMIPLARLLSEDRDPAAPVALGDGDSIPFAQLRADVAANAARFTALGCRRGLLLAEDGYWAAVGILALLHAGATVVLPQSLQRDGYGTPDWDQVVSDRPRPGTSEALLLRPADTPSGPLPPLDAEASGFLLYTAGSSGAPKATAKSLAQVDREAALVGTLLGQWVPAGAPVFGTVPLHHLYGLTFRLCWPLTSGRPLQRRTQEFWEQLAAAPLGGAALITSPAHLTRISIPAVSAAPALVLSAGAPLADPAAAQAVALLGTPVTEIYGSTETGVIAWRRRAAADPAWTAFPGIDVLAGDDGRAAIRSPLVAAHDRDAAGWHQGADLIQHEDAGLGLGFRLKGRADRIAKIEGKRVSLPDLERRLVELPLVAESAVLCLDEERTVLAAVVVPSAEGSARLAELGAFRFGRLLRQALAAAQDAAGLPRRWRFVAALPTAALGKRRQADLVALFAAPRPREPELRAVRRSDEGVELDLFIQPELAQLQGHFPSLPIVPGVAQVDWAAKLAARHLGLPLTVARRFQVKFRRVTTAGQVVTLQLRRRSGSPRLDFSYRAGEELLSSGSITLPDGT